MGRHGSPLHSLGHEGQRRGHPSFLGRCHVPAGTFLRGCRARPEVLHGPHRLHRSGGQGQWKKGLPDVPPPRPPRDQQRLLVSDEDGVQTRRGGVAGRTEIGDGNRFPGVLLGERAGRAAASNRDQWESRRTRPGVPDRRSAGAAERTGVASPAARETGLDQIPGRLVGHRHELPGGELRTRATRGPAADGEAHGAPPVHLRHPGLGFPVRPRPTGLVAPEPGHGRRNPTDRGPGIPGRGGRIRTGQDLAGRRSPRRRIATARDVRGPGAGAPG